jgi:Xaa-Pro aminopeptidase
MFDLEAIRAALKAFDLDGWLLYDFRHGNVLARRVLGLPDDAVTTRRFFYWVSASGPPRKLVHRIEAGVLDHLPGEKQVYLRWQELEAGLQQMLGGARRVAMEYAPRGANPYVSRVDAGTIELIREFDVVPVSSGDLIQLFEATWDDDQWRMHLEASEHTTATVSAAFEQIAQAVRSEKPVSELSVQQYILDEFQRRSLVTDHAPIVAVGPHSGDPHYAPSPESDVPIRAGDFVLIDLWAKLDRPRSVYSDLTRVGYVGREVPSEYEDVFQIVAQARDAAIQCVRHGFEQGEPLLGWQVDQTARDVIQAAGYGDAFCHRTGHSIGQETHGNGANIDNLETHEERRILPRTCFSIEPGIYLPDFGVRSEVDVFVDAQEKVHITGGPAQTCVLPILGTDSTSA